MTRTSIGFFVLALALASQASALDPPDSETNPQSRFIETVEAFWAGTNYNIRHVVDPGSGSPTITTSLCTHAADDVNPRISIDAQGDTHVVWQRDVAGGQIRSRTLLHGASSWGAEQPLGDPDETSVDPEIAADGSLTIVAFEVVGASSWSFAAVAIIDDAPDPFGTRVLLATTPFGGEHDVLAHAESGHAWATWIHGATTVGYSERDPATGEWSAAAYDSFASDSVQASRARIRATVLGE